MKYLVRKEIADNVINLYKRKKFEDELGLTKSYLSLIFSRKKTVKKCTAYAITKCVDVNKNLEDFFEEV